MVTVTLNNMTFEKAKINSITKYPSILTFHKTGHAGTLAPELSEGASRADKLLYITEKIDGSNSRICLFTDEDGKVKDFFLGSREEMMYVSGDRCFNENGHLVENLLPVATDIIDNLFSIDIVLPENSIVTLYCEHYGGRNNGWKQYNKSEVYGARLFDVKVISYEEVNKLMQKDITQISGARESDNIGKWYDVSSLITLANLIGMRHVPYIGTINGNNLPVTLRDMFTWLKQYAKTNAALDDGGLGKAEGVVIRSEDRTYIKKIRFEDYEKTERKGLLDIPMKDMADEYIVF